MDTVLIIAKNVKMISQSVNNAKILSDSQPHFNAKAVDKIAEGAKTITLFVSDAKMITFWQEGKTASLVLLTAQSVETFTMNVQSAQKNTGWMNKKFVFHAASIVLSVKKIHLYVPNVKVDSEDNSLWVLAKSVLKTVSNVTRMLIIVKNV